MGGNHWRAPMPCPSAFAHARHVTLRRAAPGQGRARRTLLPRRAAMVAEAARRRPAPVTVHRFISPLGATGPDPSEPPRGAVAVAVAPSPGRWTRRNAATLASTRRPRGPRGSACSAVRLRRRRSDRRIRGRDLWACTAHVRGPWFVCRFFPRPSFKFPWLFFFACLLDLPTYT